MLAERFAAAQEVVGRKAITEKHTFGWRMEEELKPILDTELGDTLIKTERRWDAVDFVGHTYRAELKSRRKFDKFKRLVTSKTHSDWLVPKSKIDASSKDDKRLCLFYYFEGDNTLWKLWIDEVDWTKIRLQIPDWHTEYHYYVPDELWARVEGNYGPAWD